MPDHTITVEITLLSDTRVQALRNAQRILDTADLQQHPEFTRWNFAIHERPDLPALLDAHRYG